jgi:signal transduction histidine kinase
VAITQELAAERPLVTADGIQIQQVVVNLLLNGIESMVSDSNGSRELAVQTALNERGEVEIRVSDRGGGLPPEMAECLFEPFHGTKREGLGMGLAISRRIVEGHGGRIWATANPGRGTTFHFTLPAGT